MQPVSLKCFLFVLVLGVFLPGVCAQAQQPAPPAGTSAAPQGSNTASSLADSLVKQGVAKGMKGDLNGAIAAFNQAIKIDPTYAPAYERRGFAFSLENRLDEAITNYNQAIQLNPKNADAYYNRGTAKGQKGDFDGAIADFSYVLELQPQAPVAYYNRGHAKYFKGDMVGAMSDLNQTVVMAPGYAPSYFIRGLVRRAQGDEEDAAIDFQASADDGFYYGAFWLWIVKMEASERGLAHEGLADYVVKPGFFKDDAFASQLADFLLGKITQDQLMAKAQVDGMTNDRLGAFWFYVGMSNFFSGDLKGAQDCFQKSVATQAKGSEEVTEAQRELAKLQATGP
jgi:lipoprotein NlpI